MCSDLNFVHIQKNSTWFVLMKVITMPLIVKLGAKSLFQSLKLTSEF